MIKRLATPPFVVACLVLLGSAVSLKAVVSFNKWVLLKEEIPPRQNMDKLAVRFGPMLEDGRFRYERYGDDAPRLGADMEEELGTKQYLTRVYRDHSKAPDEPGSMFRLHLPYYSGTIDTVPHVPDRCWTAGGAQRTDRKMMTMQLTSDRIGTADDGRVIATTVKRKRVTLPGRQIDAAFALFEDANRPSHRYGVSYFFIANGAAVAKPEGVRIKAFNFTDRYAYYCKVEVMPGRQGTNEKGETVFVPAVNDLEVANRLTSEFLSYALPEIMLCLPDWQEVKAGRYPVPAGNDNQPSEQATGVH